MPTAPSLRFIIRHPAHLLACGFGSGASPWAPGTAGTLAAWLLYPLLRPWFSLGEFCVLLAALFGIGIWAIDRTGQALGEVDHGSIVWDEMVPFWALLAFLPVEHPGWQAAAFVAFRIFDIRKPVGVRYFDVHVKNAFGVMMDDVVAAFYAWIVIWVIHAILVQ